MADLTQRLPHPGPSSCLMRHAPCQEATGAAVVTDPVALDRVDRALQREEVPLDTNHL